MPKLPLLPNYPIFIPTYGRSRIATLDTLPAPLLDKVIAVVHPTAPRPYAPSYLECPEQGKGIDIMHQWILNYCKGEGIDCCIMIDDDISLQTAIFEDGKKRFRRCRSDSTDLVYYFSQVVSRVLSPSVGKVSFSQVFFNTCEEAWQQNKDGASTHFVNVAAAMQSGASYLLPSIDDRNFDLGMLEAGFELWAHSYVGAVKVGEHGKGGDAAIGIKRGPRHEASIQHLATKYPRFVRPYITTSKDYIANYGTSQAARFLYSSMWKAICRGEDVRSLR